ncbi:MAG: glycosyltransferase family 4 protein [Thermodesulfobacteriota bacterium]
MNIATGTVFEEYGGVSKHIFNIGEFSSHRIAILPSKPMRIFLNRFRWAKPQYKRIIARSCLKRYDVLHSHADPWFERACHASRSESHKWVHTFHSLFFAEDYAGGLAGWQTEENRTLIEVCSQADLRITVSAWLQEHLQQHYGISAHVVENGVDPAIAERADAGRFVRRYRIENFILYAGGIREVKNPLFFKRLAEGMPDRHFVMVGERLDGEAFRRAYRTDIPKNLHLLGSLGHSEILDALAACKAYVLTSKREATPITLLEAMALSRPVVAPDHTGPRDVLAGSGAGFLYRPDSLDDAVRKIHEALSSGTVGQAARGWIEQKYDISKQVRKLDELYGSLA